MSNEIATRNNAMPVQTVKDMRDMAEDVAKSGLLGACTPAKAFVIVQHCAATGMSVMQFKQRYHVTNDGQVTMRADRMAGEFQARGGEIEWLCWDEKEARAKFYFGRNQGLEMSYSMDDAKRAGLAGRDNWKNHPADMLRARLISKAVRMLCPDAVAGVYEQSEVSDDVVEMPSEPKRVERDVVIEDVAVVEDVEMPDPEPEPEPTTEKFDPTLCPIPGKMLGKPWADMDLKMLEYALKLKSPEMEPEHREAIKREIFAKRETETIQ